MNQQTKTIIVSAIILLTVIMRVINIEFNIYNLIPMAALGIFCGSILQNKFHAYLIPLVALLLSDIAISLFTNTQGFYGISQFVNYASIILITLLGTYLTKRSFLQIAGYSISGSLIFFILSNFGTFLSGYYGFSFEGLLNCYAMAIPFYKSELANTFFINSFLGDLFFSIIAFGVYHLATTKNHSLKTAS